MPRRLVVFLLLLAFAFSPVFSEKRVALVIGNGAYESNARLKNPASDAADIATALKASGFTVTSLVDADRVAMEKAVRDFGNALKESKRWAYSTTRVMEYRWRAATIYCPWTPISRSQTSSPTRP